MNAERQLKLALISDDLTRACLALECRVMSVTPWNWRAVFWLWRPDILLVESAWTGSRRSWKYKIASYPDHLERSSSALAHVVAAARGAGIPAIFWNREDGAHFERFLGAARLFDKVLTVDGNTIPRYREALAPDARVDVLMFAVQPAIHFPTGEEPLRRAAFVGSYGAHVHPRRRAWQDRVFQASSELGLTVYDRNSDRRAAHFRYPKQDGIEIRKAISHARTARVYRSHAVNLNVNTIDDSSTAFSRRLVEILACGGFCVSNRTPAVEQLFADYCAIVEGEAEARALFARIAREGLSKHEREQSRAAADHIRQHHTWRHRLEQIVELAA